MTVVACFMVSAFWFPGAVRAQDITTDLILHWTLDESSGNAADSAGSRTGTLTNGPTWQPTGGQLAGALSFTAASSQYVKHDNASLSLDDFTIAAWVKPTATPGGSVYFNIFEMYDSGGNGIELAMVDDGTVRGWPYTGGYFTSSDALTSGAWNHVVLKRLGSTWSLYINGVLQSSTGAEGTTISSGTCPITLGLDYDTGCTGTLNGYWDGMMDDVRVYDRALTDLDVATLYAGYAANCLNPPGTTGHIRYNADWRTPQYCNGSSWTDMGSKKYTPKAVTFDGTDDYLTRGGDLTGNADAKTATGSFWFRRNGGTGTAQAIWSNTSARFQISFNTGNQIRLLGTTTAGTTTLDIRGGTAITDTNWHHAMFSFDMADTAKRFIYIDGAAETITETTYNNNNVDFTRAEQAMGATTTGGSKLNADIAEFWLNSGTYLDLSVAANRMKFYHNGPVYVGDDGSLPTGTAPKVFLSGDTSDWADNDGTGGGFTVNGGGLAPTVGPGGVTDIASNLAGYWKFDDGSGTSAADSSGNANTGTLTNGPTWGTGQVGGDVVFDETDDYVDMGNPTNLTDPLALTIVGWVYMPTATTTGTIANKGYGTMASNYEGYDFSTGNNYRDLSFSVGYTSQVMWARTAGAVLASAAWSHVAVTWNGGKTASEVKFYVNGSVIAHSADTNGVGTYITDGTYTFRVGQVARWPTGSSWPFGGSIDDLRVYTRVLTAAEISALHAGTQPCSSPAGAAGKIVFNDDANVMQYCDGADWQAMGRVDAAGGAGCTNPTRGPGAMIYNDDATVMQYCDGANWVRIGKKWEVPASGLIHHWAFDETSGTTADDAVGTADGGLSGAAAFAAGHRGNALDVDGSGSAIVYVTPNNMPANNAAKTIAMWLYSRESPSGGTLFDMTNSGSSSSFRFEQNGDFKASKWGGTSLVSSGVFPTPATWYFAAYTYDGTTHRLYVNGSEIGSDTVSSNTAVPTTVTIGASFNENGGIDGLIDDVYMYNRALSATELQSLYYATGGM